MRRLVALAALIALSACRESGPQPASQSRSDPHDAAGSVARFGDSVITADDVDAHVLALAAEDRPLPGEDLEAWFREQIRVVAVGRWLRDAAEMRGTAGEEAFLARQHEVEHRLGLQLCVRELRPQLDAIDDEELREAYAERADQFNQPERRSTYHLFRRAGAGPNTDSAAAELEALRDRVLQGENFQRLAMAASDSESRHQGASLGWVVRGQLPEGFERVIFALDEGVPSAPVMTVDGGHLFYVDNVLPARRYTFDEARSVLEGQLAAERLDAVLDEIAGRIETPQHWFFPTRDEFAELVNSGDDAAIVLQSDAIKLSLRQLRAQLGRGLARQPQGTGLAAAIPVALAWRVLERLERQEKVYGHCRDRNAIPAQELAARTQSWRERALVAVERQRRLNELALRHEQRLRLFYQSNIDRFSTAPRWQLRRLRVALDRDAPAVMARLEEASRQPGISLADLHDELGGELDDLDWRDLAGLKNLDAKLPALVAPLMVGELSSPYRTSEALEMVECTGTRDAEPIPFDEVRQRAAQAYVEYHTREVYAQLAAEILEAEPLEILPEGLAALKAAGLPQPDVSVEQLEKLFDGL